MFLPPAWPGPHPIAGCEKELRQGPKPLHDTPYAAGDFEKAYCAMQSEAIASFDQSPWKDLRLGVSDAPPLWREDAIRCASVRSDPRWLGYRYRVEVPGRG